MSCTRMECQLTLILFIRIQEIWVSVNTCVLSNYTFFDLEPCSIPCRKYSVVCHIWQVCHWSVVCVYCLNYEHLTGILPFSHQFNCLGTSIAVYIIQRERVIRKFNVYSEKIIHLKKKVSFKRQKSNRKEPMYINTKFFYSVWNISPISRTRVFWAIISILI